MALRLPSSFLFRRANLALLQQPRAGAQSLSINSLITPEQERVFPGIGKREIVGYGRQGVPFYYDDPMFPYPAIRFRELTDKSIALRQKELGDWKKLSLEEKKALYRESFCQTLVEYYAPSGRWKISLAWCLGIVSVTLWVYIAIKKFLYGPLPITFSEEHRRAEMYHRIMRKEHPVTGLASKFDYDQMKWK